eukprot:TRINITY_DN469_c0_g1_i1.p1 TRINITY_DN469_c0_g1~~TRINITY_DN469_c0_g1_i1.p1  ORF type:complete len:522 (+),score=156.90 TRINITY_DN469_c0_g1_i1:64-1629(+)
MCIRDSIQIIKMIKNLTFVSLFIFFLILQVQLKTKAEWKNRAVYQIITDRFEPGSGKRPKCDIKTNGYCGGTFKGIQERLDYIKNLGFDAIWISPVIENVGDNFHGYAAKNLYNINPYFGTSYELLQLVRECHKKDIWVMVDVAPNHMACLNYFNIKFSDFTPFNKEEYFHPECSINFPDGGPVDIQNFQECRLACLTDLNQDHPFVRQKLLEWIKDLVQKYELDGLRIDTVPEVAKDFWREFANAAGVFQVGEVFDSRINFVSGYQGVLDSVFNYPAYQMAAGIFKSSGKLREFELYFKMMYVYEDRFAVGSFADNHDNSRFLNNFNDEWSYKNYLAFQMTQIGIPFLYYGAEQGFNGGGDPWNREPMWKENSGDYFNQQHIYYRFLQKIMTAKKQQLWNNYDQIQSYADDVFYAFTRNKDVFLFTTTKADVVRNIGYPKVHKSGEKLCNILYDGDCVTAKADGSIDINLWHGEAKIYIPEADYNSLKAKYPNVYKNDNSDIEFREGNNKTSLSFLSKDQ